jgi:hypothetical protein
MGVKYLEQHQEYQLTAIDAKQVSSTVFICLETRSRWTHCKYFYFGWGVMENSPST